MKNLKGKGNGKKKTLKRGKEWSLVV